MASIMVILGLIALGYVLGWVFSKIVEKMDKVSFLGGNLYAFIVGSFYFACLFSAPLSGNIALFIIVVGILLYTLFGGFAENKLKPKKPEDKVTSKWFPGYP